MSDKKRKTTKRDSLLFHRTRVLRAIKLEDEILKKLADDVLAEKRRLCRKQEQLANLLREREEAEGSRTLI